jgi:hypothetical protein
MLKTLKKKKEDFYVLVTFSLMVLFFLRQFAKKSAISLAKTDI